MNIAGFLGGFEWLIIGIAGLLFFLLPLFALISIVKNEFQGNNKLVWIIIVIIIPYLGSILYFLFGRGQQIRDHRI